MFVVVDGDRMAVATTGADPTVGLVFYDLKTLLRQVATTASRRTRRRRPMPKRKLS